MDSLIIGSTSVVGDAIATELADLGQVKTAGRRKADFDFDLADPDTTAATGERFDVAVLVAADFGGPTDDDITRAIEVNVVGALAACRLALNVGVKHFVLISSVSATFTADDPYYGIYSLSKRQSEEVVDFYCRQHDITLTILQPTGLYDAAGRCRAHQGLLYGIVDCARAGSDFTISGSADPVRNYLHVADLARVVKRVVETAQPGTYVCAGPQSATVGEIARLAFEVFGRGGQVRFDASKGDIPSTRPLPDSAVYDDLSVWPIISLEEGLRQIRDFRPEGHRT